jgi:hypothetical protein
MNDIVNGNISVKQPAMGIFILVLPVKEEATATLRIKVPKQYTKTALGQEASQVNGRGSFANASFNIIYGDLFQKLKTKDKAVIVIIIS